jgi:hypothetical protein
MPRPSRNLTRISVYLPADALNGLDAKAAQIAGTRSDVIRLAVESYLDESAVQQRILALHERVAGRPPLPDWCAEDNQAWPCDTAVALANDKEARPHPR